LVSTALTSARTRIRRASDASLSFREIDVLELLPATEASAHAGALTVS
jgi:hypothetical protein